MMVYSSKRFLCLMIVSGMVAAVGSFVFGEIDENSCRYEGWAVQLPWLIMLCVLIGKVYRVWYILGNRKLLRRVVMTEMSLLKRLAVVITILVIFYTLRSQLDARTPNENQSDIYGTYTVCQGENDVIFDSLYYVILVILFGSGMLLSHVTKNFTTAFNESRHLASALGMCTFIIPVKEVFIMIVSDKVVFPYLMKILAILFTVTYTVVSIIGPKIYLIMKNVDIEIDVSHGSQHCMEHKSSGRETCRGDSPLVLAKEFDFQTETLNNELGHFQDKRRAGFRIPLSDILKMREDLELFKASLDGFIKEREYSERINGINFPGSSETYLIEDPTEIQLVEIPESTDLEIDYCEDGQGGLEYQDGQDGADNTTQV